MCRAVVPVRVVELVHDERLVPQVHQITVAMRRRHHERCTQDVVDQPCSLWRIERGELQGALVCVLEAHDESPAVGEKRWKAGRGFARLLVEHYGRCRRAALGGYAPDAGGGEQDLTRPCPRIRARDR